MSEAQALPAGKRLVVFGYGNISRSDDAIGPLLLARLEAAGLPGVETIEDFQLQIEHALDLKGADLALFIDAGTGTPAPYSFYEVAPRPGLTHTSHALLPESVLDVYGQVLGGTPPPAFVLCVRGESFELAEGMTPVASVHMEAAWDLLQALCAEPDAGRWREQAGSAPG